MAKKLWAGLDIGELTTSLCVIDNAGEVVRETVCATNVKSIQTELKFLKRRRFARVGLETGVGTAIARGLRDRGYSVDIYEARQLSKFLRLRRNKTDAGDANGIAQAGRLAAPMVSKVHLKSLDSQSLMCRIKLRRFLIQTRNRSLRLLCSQLQQYGARVRSQVRHRSFPGEVEGHIRAVFGKDAAPIASELRDLLRFCEGLIRQQQARDEELLRLAQANEVCRRFMEIPGVGPLCALTFYAAIDEPMRFRRSKDVGAYLGLTPRIRQSGLTHRSGRISRMGNKETRYLLVHSAIRFLMCAKENDALRAWTSAIENRRGKGKSRVALARKLATIMLAMWKTGEPYHQKVVDLERPQYADLAETTVPRSSAVPDDTGAVRASAS